MYEHRIAKKKRASECEIFNGLKNELIYKLKMGSRPFFQV